jgi:peptidyl-prolyl cis-trans isomerase D
LFARDEPLAGLGFAQTVANEAFSLEKGKVSGAIRTSQGYAFIALTDVKPSYAPKLEDVKDKVRDAVITAKAVEIAKSRAAAMAKNGTSNFEAAAKAAGATVRSTDFVTRGSAYPEVGVSDALDTAAFALKPGETSAPVATDSSVVVVRLRERQDIDPSALAAERETLRAQLTEQRRQEFFSAYMANAIRKMDVRYNQATVTNLLGS